MKLGNKIRHRIKGNERQKGRNGERTPADSK
jgi:hypothetical protein